MANPTTSPKSGTPTTNAKTTPAPIQATTVATTAKPDAGALRALTEKLAYELYEKRGKKHGYHHADWLEAEKIAKAKLGL